MERDRTEAGAAPLAEVLRLALLGLAPLGAIEAVLERMEAGA